MIGVKINQVKGMVLDAPKVMRSVDAATRRVLSRFGAFVRTAAKSSIRKRRRESEPGQPPSSHTGLLRRFIYFGYDSTKRSVVIGPTLLNKEGGESVLSALEHGGETVISTLYKSGRNKHLNKRVRVTIAVRPFMAPALKQELPKLPAMWANSVKP
jgi:hypothetical protein